MTADKKADILMDRLKRKVEVSIITLCIIIIVACCVYIYIVRPIKDKPTNVAYEKFKSFSMPIGDVSGTEDYEDETVRTYTDDWGIRYDVKERIK